MAYPAENDLETAIDNLLLAADEDPTDKKARELRRLVLKVASLLEALDTSTYDGFFSEGAWSENAS
jgi:hypothetical protein